MAKSTELIFLETFLRESSETRIYLFIYHIACRKSFQTTQNAERELPYGLFDNYIEWDNLVKLRDTTTA